MNIVGVGFHLFLMLFALGVWKFSFFPSNFLHTNRRALLSWLALMFACECLIYLLLVKWSAPSVHEDAGEITFYLVFSMIWIVLTQGLFAFLGVSVRDDVAERRNLAAGFAAAGLTIAATGCAAGSNIGDGPGFEVMFFCAGISTASLLILWAMVAQVSGIAEAITIDRNVGAGIRAAGWLAGTGMVLGTCVAGDWISYAATLKDLLRFGWPVAVSAFLYMWMERALNLRSTGAKLSRTASILTSAVMFATGAAYAHWVGRH